MLEKHKEKLSILWCNLVHDGYRGTELVEYDGFSEKVYLFEADYTHGLTTDWKHIMLNKHLFHDGFENARRQMFLHEKAHQNSSTLHLVSGWFPMLYFYVLAPATVLGISTFLVAELVFNASVLGLTVSTVQNYLYIMILLFPLAVVTSYLLETKAELFSLRYMEPEEFLEAKERLENIQPLNIWKLLFMRLTHPSPEFVLKVHRLMESRKSR